MSFKTIGTNSIDSTSKKFVIRDRYGEGAVGIQKHEVPSLTEALKAWAGDGQRPDAALLIGGPRHMEFMPIPQCGGAHLLLATTLTNGPPLLDPKDELMPDLTHHTYTLCEIYPSFPFAIYEHSSLQNANVKRRAEQLDAQLVRSVSELAHAENRARFALKTVRDSAETEQLAREKQHAAVKVANEAEEELRSAEQSCVSAKNALEHRQLDVQRADEKLQQNRDERTQITYDHGI